MSIENTAVTKKKIKRCKEDVVFDAACFIILTLVLFVVAYPLYWVIISSISAPSAVSSGKVLLHPIGFTLKGYAEVFKNDQVMRGFLNSLIITFCGVMVNLIVTLPTSYALSRSNFSGKKPITIFYLITMFFGGGLIPTYLVIQRLQMLNTIWALILPGCLSVYNMIVARTFFKSNISEELYEAAEIDGCTTFKFLYTIGVPLIKQSLGALIIYVFLQSWNYYLWPLLVTDSVNMRTVLSGLGMLQGAEATDFRPVMAGAMVILIPSILVFIIGQKQMISGLTAGAVKG